MFWQHLPSEFVRKQLTECTYRRRMHLLRMLDVSVGSESYIHAPFRMANCKPKHLKSYLTCGSNVYIGMDCLFDLKDQIRIGDRVTLAYRVNLLTHWNPGASAVVKTKPPCHAPITIENDVYIGTNASILPGVILGEGSMVGAGAVVTKNVPPHVFVAGTPASVVRSLETTE